MTARPDLADRLALAILEHGPSSGSRLAGRLAARKATVLRELKANPMFERVGNARGSTWRLAGNRVRPPWEPMGTDSGGPPMSEVTRAEFDLLQQRVDELERLFAVRGAERPA